MDYYYGTYVICNQHNFKYTYYQYYLKIIVRNISYNSNYKIYMCPFPYLIIQDPPLIHGMYYVVCTKDNNEV